MFPVKVSVSNRPSTPLVAKNGSKTCGSSKNVRPGIAAQKKQGLALLPKKQPQSKALLSTNFAATVPSSLAYMLIYQQEQIALLSAVIVMCSLYNACDLLFVYFARISMYLKYSA